ncbi:MAG: hypothetical protein CEN92_184 [Candidatus Berkelbacteria bacterium Licking1014_96]|uniref:Uncharacterized protein n=1 Tax=Candidatus Berkelbacteria bacterium Licking1014_96 TaxID=2017149 RepID=A0A554LG50_9BACT|nr:MAG: hypothetical protein CEN92_184 [Candidatus Berkelbacteria bacterium Licking1014_96]
MIRAVGLRAAMKVMPLNHPLEAAAKAHPRNTDLVAFAKPRGV